MNVTPPVASGITTKTALLIHDRRLLWAARIAWWLIVVLVMVTLLIVLTFRYHRLSNTNQFVLTGLQQLGISSQIWAIYYFSIRLLAAVAYLSGAFVIFYLRSNNWMAWLTSLSFLTLSLVPNASLPILILARPDLNWIAAIIYYCCFWSALGFLYLFPDGRIIPNRLKILFIPYALWEVFRVSYALFILNNHDILLGILWNIPLIMILLIGLAAQVYRYQRSSAVERQQTKWVGFGIAILILSFILDFLPPLLSSNPASTILTSLITHSLLNLSSIVLVVCMGFAITRYRLWDINIVINRSLVYGSVTLLLVAVFLGGLLLLRWLLGTEQSGLAFAGSLIIAGVLFNPTRQRVQHLIDRRLYHFRFDLNQLAAAQEPPVIKNPGFLTGRVIENYQVLGVLGKGGMGEVYQGQDAEKRVAIKILSHELTQELPFRRRFEREAQTLAGLDHPHIVKLYRWGESGDTLYMILEYIDGRDLGDILKQRGTIPFDEMRPFIAEIADALDYAHRAGFVHRDIKPSNIMLRLKTDGETQEAVLMDFGIAKVQDAQTSLTGTGAIGTIGYMAPEQIMAAREVDHRADIYALGIVIYELLVGERPFKGIAAQVLFGHLQQPPPDPREIVADVPSHVAVAIKRALAKEPDERFQTVGEFATALLAHHKDTHLNRV
jgi:predicted Ser/Thr protein kinase